MHQEKPGINYWKFLITNITTDYSTNYYQIYSLNTKFHYQSGYSHCCSANNLSDAPYSHSRPVYCHHSFASVQSGRQPVTVPDLYHVITCHHFKLWTGCKTEVGQTINSWSQIYEAVSVKKPFLRQLAFSFAQWPATV